MPYKHVELPQSSIHAEVVGNANTYTIALQSNVYTPFVEVDFTDADVILSDNIINLTDDKPHVISFETKDVINGSFPMPQTSKTACASVPCVIPTK